MGATFITVSGKGANAREVFTALSDDARAEYGYDHYNGTISTCSMGRLRKTISGTPAAKRKELEAFLRKEEDGYLEKGIVNYVDMGITEYIVRTVSKKPHPYTAKYKQKFAVCDMFEGNILRPEKRHIFDQKTPADTLAVKYSTEGKSVCVRKMMVNLEGEDIVTTFRVEEKRVKKPTKAQLKNATVIPVHEYVFYGLAYC